MNPLLLTMPDAAKALGVGRTTAYRLAAKGEIPVIDLAGRKRIPLAALNALIDQKLANPLKES